MKKSKGPHSVSWQRVSLIVLCVILALVLFVMVFATAYINHLIGMITIQDTTHDTLSPDQIATATEAPDDTIFTGPSVDHSDVTISTLPSIPPEELKAEGIINIMLIGEDRRPGEGRQRSDSMILCSFNTNNNTITMISFLRDTYVSIPGFHPEKLNAAYCFGGSTTLDQTLAANFGVHVDANVMVQFDGFEKIIDMLGGVDIELTAKEAKYLNTSDLFAHYGWNLSAGKQHLDGAQTLAYSRIRKIDMDAMRAKRQRTVLTALINAYKNKSLTEMVTLSSKILETGFIQTDMTAKELTNYVIALFPILSTATINSQQIPAQNTYTEMSVGSLTYCKVPDLEANRAILKKFLK